MHGNQKAKATVSAIIDGTGSIGMYKQVNIASYILHVGAALGPLLTGWISDDFVRFLVSNYM